MSEKNVFEEIRQVLDQGRRDILERHIDNEQFMGGQIEGLNMAYNAVDIIESKWLDEKLSNVNWIQTSKRMPNHNDKISENFCDEERGYAFVVMINGADYPTQLYLTKKNEWVDDELRVYNNVDAWCKIPSILEDVWIDSSKRLPDDIERGKNGNHFLVLIKGAMVPTELSITQDNRWIDIRCKEYKISAWTHFPNAYFYDEVSANG